MLEKPLPYEKIVFVCANQRPPGERVCCADGGGGAFRDKLKAAVKERGLAARIRVSQSGCMHRCEKGPNIMVFPDNLWFSNVQESDLGPLLDKILDGVRKSEG